MRYNAWLIFAATGLALGAVAPAARAGGPFIKTIDEFIDPAFSLTVDATAFPANTSKAAFTVTPTVIGGERDVFLLYVGFPPPDVDDTDRSRMRLLTATGALSLSTDSGVTPWAQLSYAGLGRTNSVNENFAAGGANAVRLDFIRNDLAMDIRIDMYSRQGTGLASKVSQLVAAPALNAAFKVFFNYGSFALQSGPGFDFTDVDRVDVMFFPQTGSDFTLDAIGTVPTPGSAALVAAAGLIGLRRRRN
ncbi:MAG: hypothetical protein K2Q09_00560 [Phycisphaerales bacterium]|nr:hypothetical protein [Phycisphaerales bacterium]